MLRRTSWNLTMLTKSDYSSDQKQRAPVYLCALLFLLVARFTSEDVLAQQKIVAPKPLALNTSIDGLISESDSVTYAITLQGGRSLNIEMLATRLDVDVVDPMGQVIASLACDNRHLTPLTITTKTSGQYLLVVRRPDQRRNIQYFTIHAIDSKPASSTDATRIKAELLFTKATRLRRKWETKASEEALELFQNAQTHWATVRDLKGESLALLAVGETCEALDQTKKALASYERALELSAGFPDKRRQMETLAKLASYHINAGESAKALEYGNRGLELARKLQDKHIEAEVFNCLGDGYYDAGDLPRAVDYYKQSFALFDAVGNSAGKAFADTNLGYAYLNLGEAEQARTAFREALALSNESGDGKMQTLTYRSLGNFYSKVGQPQQALAALRKALEIVEQGEGLLLKARVVAGIGHTYLQLRDFEKALAYDTEAVNMFQRLGNKWGEAELRMDLGEIHYYRNERDEALSSYNSALPLFRELGMTRFEAQTLSSIGVVYASRGDYEKALDYYNQSLRLTRSGQDQRYDAYTLNYLGELQLATGKQTEATQNFRDALSLNQQASDPVGEVMTLYNLARLARDTGSLTDATNYSEQALKIIESVRTAVAGEKLRANFAASVHQHYELRVDILMRQHEQMAALEVSERGRARSWLESLGEAGAEIREGVDQALLDRADALQKKLDAKSQEQIRLMTRAHTDKEEQALAQELRKLASDYEEVEGEIRANSQRYARLPQASALTGLQIQQQVDNDSLLLEFSLGEDRSYVWVVSSEWIKGFELPSRKVIEPVCRRLYESLAARSRRTNRLVAAGYAVADAEAERSSKELGQILFKPIHELLGRKRLLIVSEGELQYVPFEVLADASDQPLIADHQIVYLPSASVIAEQRAKFKNRPVAPKTIVIFADPVFEDTDERVAQRASHKNTRPRQGSSAGRIVSNSTRSTGDSESTNALRAAGFNEGIPRLPYSNQEARRIISLVPPGQGVAELGFDANRTVATSGELAKYRYIHFATHGLLNSEHPELSGILLSMVNASGSSQNGFLQLHEIYKMQLPVELVVLSACQTALGKEVRGEGLFGLTRGFMYVGAMRAVSSLWKVDDSATAELMELFYKEMLQHGSTPAAALQTAKNKFRRQKPWQAPFYWAGFIIQGDWR